MKRALLVAVLALGVTPEARGEDSIERWLGTWSGKATWKGCSVEGSSTVEVAVTWHDDMLWLDGSAIYEGLGEVAPEVREDGAMVFETDDISITLTPPRRKAKRAVLRFSTAAQCTMTAKLSRAGATGIAECDALAALTEVATSCEVDPGEALAKRTAKACGTRVRELRERLEASDCVPPENDPADLPACREVWKLAQRIMRCTRASAEFQQATIEHAADLRHGLRVYARMENGVELATEKCNETAEVFRETADEILQCP